MLLATTDLGLATVWIEGQLFAGEAGQIAKILDAPERHEVRVLLPLGYPVTHGRQKEKMPFEERAWYNRYGNTSE
jgi:nitroreductase